MSIKVDLSRITAYRVHTLGASHTPGTYPYRIEFDGSSVLCVLASDLPQARGLARKALREAFDSQWNQTLIYRGDLVEGDVSRVQLRVALQRVFEASARFEG